MLSKLSSLEAIIFLIKKPATFLSVAVMGTSSGFWRMSSTVSVGFWVA